MGNTQVTDERAGSQFQPFSEESNLLNAEQSPNAPKENKSRMPSFKNIAEILKNMEYPFNQLNCFY